MAKEVGQCLLAKSNRDEYNWEGIPFMPKKEVNSEILFNLLTAYWYTERCSLSTETAGLEVILSELTLYR